MVQSISLDTKDVKIDSKNTKPTTSTNTNFLDLLLKDIKDKDLDKNNLKDKEEDTKDDKKEILKDLLNFDTKTNNTDVTNIKITDLLNNAKTDTKLNENDLKEIKNIITSQLKQNNILLSKQDVNDFKKMDNLKDLIGFADKKGLNIEKLKFDIAKNIKTNDNKHNFMDTSNLSSTKMKLDNLQKKPTKTIDLEKKTDEKPKTVSLENILNTKEIKNNQSTIQNENINKEIKTTQKEIKLPSEKKSFDLSNLLNPDKEDKKIKIESKQQQSNENSMNLPNQNMVNEVKAKSVQAKETIKYFNQNLDEAIKNYKPPVSKINIELNPQNLGKVDVTIVQRGNNIQVHMNTDQSNVQLFQNNQAEFRQALSAIGFSNIDMSFNSNQDRDRKQNQAKKTYKENENIDSIDNIEAGNVEIKASYQYA